MPDSTVDIVFQADTTSMTAAFSKINSELAESSSKASYEAQQQSRQSAYWSDLAVKQKAQETEATKRWGAAQSAAGKEASGGIKEASGAMEAFHRVGEMAQEKVKEFGSDLLKFGLGAVGIGAAFEMLKQAVDIGAEAQAFHVQLEAILGDAAKATEVSEALEKAAKATSTSQAVIDATSKELLMSGMDADKAPKTAAALVVAAKTYHESLPEITSLISRVQIKGDEGLLSAREFTKLSMLLGPTAVAAARDYATLDRNLEVHNQLLARGSVLQQRAYKTGIEDRAAQRTVEAAKKEATDTFNEKTGTTKGVGDDYLHFLKTNFGARARQSQGKYTDAADPTKARAQSQDLINRMEEGSKRIADLTGRSQGAMDEAVKSGQYTPAELLKSSDEGRMAARGISDKAGARAQEGTVQGVADSVEEATRVEKLKKREMAESVVGRLTDVSSEALRNFAKEQATLQGKTEAAGASLSRLGEIIGGALIKASDDFGGGAAPGMNSTALAMGQGRGMGRQWSAEQIAAGQNLVPGANRAQSGADNKSPGDVHLEQINAKMDTLVAAFKSLSQ